MPELPEVETLSRALTQSISGQTIRAIRAFRPNLRAPIPDLSFLVGQTILKTSRRSKYLRIHVGPGPSAISSNSNKPSAPETGSIIIHLGMSGHMHFDLPGNPRGRHDHWEIEFEGGKLLRLQDPRRFGAVLWEAAGDQHDAFKHLGPEPLEPAFTPVVLALQIGSKKSPIKTVIMDARVVVGVGNIYASEALFHAKISPLTPADRLSADHLVRLVSAIQHVLFEGIRLGGATLRDYHQVDGSDGAFASATKVYGRSEEPCLVCKTPIASQKLSGRNTFWCPRCQPVIKASKKKAAPKKAAVTLKVKAVKTSKSKSEIDSQRKPSKTPPSKATTKKR